jgi:YVTN family beta-propeller protein
MIGHLVNPGQSVVAASLAMAALVLCVGPARASPLNSANPPNLYAFTIEIGDSQTTANSVLFDGQYIWVGVEGKGGGALEKLTQTGVELSTTPVGFAPIEMTYDGARVWVTNYTSSTVSIVDQNGVVVRTIFLPTGAHPEGIFFDGKYVWVANNGLGVNSVSKFDAGSMAFVATYPVGLAPDGIAFDGTYIWVTNSFSDNVMKLDRETGEILRTYPTGVYPLSIIFDGKDIWVGNGDFAYPDLPPLSTASLTKLRPAGGVLLGTFAAGNAVRGLAHDGTSIWACNSDDNSFTRVRSSDGASMGTYPAGKAPRGIAFDGVRMWISNSGENTLTVVSPRSDPLVITPAVAVDPAFGIFTPAVEITPRLLAPLVSTGAEAASDITAIQPRVAPAVAALAGIVDALLDNN